MKDSLNKRVFCRIHVDDYRYRSSEGLIRNDSDWHDRVCYRIKTLLRSSINCYNLMQIDVVILID